MKRLIVFLLLCCCDFLVCASEPQLDLEYAIRPVMENGKSVLEVTLRFQGHESGMTEIVLPSSADGQEELYLEISELHSLSPQAIVVNTDWLEIKEIHHPPHESIQIRYHVTSRKKQGVEWYYRPLVTPSYFFFFGHGLFILPDIDDQMTHISLEWQDFPSDWNLANTFGVQRSKQEMWMPLSTFQRAVYLGGDFQILECGHKEAPIFVAIRGDWGFSSEHLTQLIQTVIDSHRQFWNDFDFPYYLITILSTEDDPHMGGTAGPNTFSIFMGDFSEDDQEDWKWLAWLLSHEHFHTWNGLKMMSGPPDGSFYWFTEGFTEYYSVKLNHLTKLIDFNDYLRHVNSILKEYYSSSVHNEANTRIQQDFWNDTAVQRLPYVRGFLFALKWDRQIREVSQGQYCLDDFMRTLFHRTQENQRPFSQEDIEQVASLFLPLNWVQEYLKKYIEDGESLVPQESDFNGRCSVEWKEDMGSNRLIPQYQLKENQL